MKTRLALFGFLLLWLATPAFAHKLDEYLQAATIAVDTNHVALQLRLTPGVAVFRTVLAEIDTNRDGEISDAEQQAYAQRVQCDLSLTVDGKALPLRLVSSSFPTLDEMKRGFGDILLSFEADVPRGSASRKLTFQNHHQSGIAAYLVNCLLPRDPDIQVAAQERNYDHSFYQLDYTQAAGGGTTPPPAGLWSRIQGWFDETGSRSLFVAFVCQGVRHILTGYDHLLFVSALVLAATTFWDLIKVVTAFTIAHTITLTLAALDLVHLPAYVVEPLISASIVVVALQNVLRPGQARGRSRLAAAFFFGLFHGLGFAGGLLEAMREMPSGTMFLAILAFSIGIETGHQMVVLPLFALLKAARRSQADVVKRTHLTMAFQRIGSVGISAAGVYYLCVALTGNS
jgi:hydrogenase/urease accessory protein HupE